MKYDYRVIPFVAEKKNQKQTLADAASEQFCALIMQQQEEGYEYVRMDHYTAFSNPGCMASLFGAGKQSTVCDVAIFRKPLAHLALTSNG